MRGPTALHFWEHETFDQEFFHITTPSRCHCQGITKKYYYVVIEKVIAWGCWGGGSLLCRKNTVCYDM